MELFKTIYADPPWPESGGGKIKRGADRHYPLMAIPDIQALLNQPRLGEQSFAEQIDRDAHLYLWVTNNFLQEGLDTLEVWGFRYVTKVTWFKTNGIGLGQYFRGETEDCLFGVRGKTQLPATSNRGRTSIHAPRGRHSEKPEEMRQMIERVSPGPYLELFAREQHEGWTVWGNEVGA